ncbi:hypothetical protein K438DRAFT_1766939 [Mycena galopus ATCC 62051]|nr:hypothetical protein K438DRAFT_1766939 [Mycena galopus ATCC 62051]
MSLDLGHDFTLRVIPGRLFAVGHDGDGWNLSFYFIAAPLCWQSLRQPTFDATKTTRVAASTPSFWVARDQTEHYVNARAKSFKTWDEAIHWWNRQCTELHPNGCPPFEPVTFSLAGDSRTQPGPDPCTFYGGPSAVCAAAPAPVATAMATPASAPAPTTAAPVASSSTTLPPVYTVVSYDVPAGVQLPRQRLSPAGSPFSSTSYSLFSTSSVSSDSDSSTESSVSSASLSSTRSPRVKTNGLTRSPRVKPEDVVPDLIPPPKEEPVSPRFVPGVTLNTRVHLTPAGHRYAESLQVTTPTPANTPTPAARRPAATPAAVLPSIVATPHGPHVPTNVAAAPPAPAPPAVPTAAAPAARRRAYGIRGVPVFYATYGSALAAALKLGLDDSKIMFSDNADKLEKWMSGKPFLGEE